MTGDPRTQKQLLAIITRFFSDDTIPDPERKGTWDVLSALRGPDDGNNLLKEATVAVVRGRVLPRGPRGAKLVGPMGVMANPDTPALARRRRDRVGMHGHFLVHARAAFTALGLSWERTNSRR